MIDIDFLPGKYHEAKIQRRTRYYRILVLVAFFLLLGLGWAGEYGIRLRIERELADVRQQYDTAQAQSQALAALELKLKTIEADAELWTYLRHPWPRTQVLSQLLAPVPEAILLTRVRIQREVVRTSPPVASPGGDKKVEDKSPPATKDLRRLREQTDHAETVVLLEGITHDNISLHSYLGRLANQSLFARAELTSLESVDQAPAGTSQFHARLVVKPGYGQKGNDSLTALVPSAEGGRRADEGPTLSNASAAATARTRRLRHHALAQGEGFELFDGGAS